MHKQSAHSAGAPRASSHAFVSSFFSLFAIALLCMVSLWPQAAAAAPSAYCPTLSMSVANSGSQTININHCHGGFGIAAGTAATPNGSRTVGVQSGANIPLTYTHNGNSATSDTFIIKDDFNNDIVTTVTIGPASSITIVATPTVALTVGVPFSTTLSATGGTGPYTFVLDSALPPGLSLSGNTISGTPSQRGAYAFTVRATDNVGDSGVRTFSGSATNPTLAIAPSSPPNAAQGVPYSVTFSGSGGISNYTYAHEAASGPLPPGLSLSGATLSGTPTTLGSFTFGIRLTDNSTGTGSYAEVETVTLQVVLPPTIVVNPATTSAATVGVAYSQTFTGSGGTAPYTFAIAAGVLPAGLSLNAATGALTGTPTAAGSFNFTLRATDANSFSGTGTYTLVVAPPTITIAPTTLPSGTVAAAYNQVITASGGISPYTYGVTAGALPAGLTLSTGIISGTPTAGGTFNFTVTATGSSTGIGAPHTGARAYSLVIAPPTVNLPATILANGTQGVAYSATLNPASGGTLPHTYALTAGSLPTGLTLNAASGALSGTPSASGTFNFSVTATDSSTGSGAYSSVPRGYSLQIVNLPPVANPVSANVAYNSGSNPITLNITGGVPSSVAIGTAAANGSAIASGTTITYQPNPGYAGPDSFTYTATNGAGTSVPATVSITVGNPTITVSAGGPLTTQVGVAYTQTFTWNGGTQPFSGYAVTGLPAGLSITAQTANSATVSGTPTAAGSFALNASAIDSSTGNGPFTVGQVFTLSVSAPTLTLIPAAGTLSATYGAAYSQTYVAGGGTAPYNYAVSAGALPAGLSLDTSTGVISGTPTATGLFNFSVRVADSSTGTGAPFARTQNYVLQVAAPTITVTPPTLSNAQIGMAYSQTLAGNGGSAPYTFAITAGALPNGITLSLGTLSGTPTSGGTFNFTVTATDNHGQTGARAYSLNVGAATISVAPATLPSGGVAQAYSQNVTASGGSAGYSFAVTAGALPTGLSLAANGTISGTPTAGGSFNFTITATDSSTGSGPYTGARAYSVLITAATVVLPPSVLPNGTVSSGYGVAIAPATGGTAPYSYAVSSGSLPPGLSIGGAGAITGTPTTPGSYSFSLTATDSSTGNGPYSSAPQSYSLQIGDIVPVANPVSATVAYGSSANSITLNITGGIPASVAVAAAPAHGTATASGTSISYTPTAGYAGPDTFTYTATNNAGTSAPATVNLTVSNPTITVTATGTLSAQVGTNYSQTFTWAGGTAPYSGFTVSGLPAGLTISGTTTNSVTVSGTPTATGSFNLNASTTDSSTGNGPFTTGQTFVLTVGVPTLSMTPAPGNLPMNYGVATTINFASGGGTAPYSYSLTSGSLPVGVSLSSAGVLSGTPTVPGNYNINVRSIDASTGVGAPFSLQQSYTIVVAMPTIAIDPASLPNGTAGTAYNAQLSSSGGVAPYSYSLLAGALPIGMSFNSTGTLSGIPRSDGNFSITVRSTDSNGQNASRVYTFTVAAATVVITPASLSGGVIGTAYSQSLSSSGGIAPYSYSIVSGTLPIGIAFSSAGVFSGVPSTAGSYTAVVRSTDDAGYNSTQSYTIVIADAVPVAVNDNATTLSQQAVTIPVTANDSGVITSVAVASAPAHGSATVSGSNVIYTPAGSYFGADSFTYTATGPGGSSAPATVSITVTALPVPVAQPRTAITTLAGQPVIIDTTVGATGGPFSGVTLVTAPATGTTTVSGTNITYTPLATASGAVSIVYTLNNAYGASAPVTATITVNPVPVAVSRRVSANAGVPAVVELTTGASGGPFTAANLVSLSPASAGTATIASSGSGASAGYRLTFTPAATFSGTATASFTLSNAFATSAPAAIDFDVIGRPDPTQDAEVMGLLGAQTATARRFANAQIGNFQRRMEGMHDGGNGARFENGLSFDVQRRCQGEALRMPGSDCRQLDLLDDAAPGANATAAVSTGKGADDGGSLTLWTNGSINSGDHDGRSGSAGFDFQTSGISAGADTRVNQDFAFGAGIGYGRDTTDVGRNDTRSRGESYTLAMYGSYHPGEYFFVDGLFGYQLLSFDSRRYVTANGAMVSGVRDGKQWFASLSLGGDYRRDRLSLVPYARLDVARATLDGYSERGDAIHALRYQDQDVDTTTSSLGLRMDYRFPVSVGTFSPQTRFEYQHDFQGDSSVTMSYADLPGGPFYRGQIDGLKRNRFVFGLGAVLQTERDFTLRFEYRGLFGSEGDSDHGVLLNLEKKY